MEGGQVMAKDKIKKLLDEIDKISLEGWDYNLRINFQDVMRITGEIEKELKGCEYPSKKGGN